MYLVLLGKTIVSSKGPDARHLRQRLQTLRLPTQALQWVHFSTLLSTLIQAMKKKAAVFTALGHVTCRHYHI